MTTEITTTKIAAGYYELTRGPLQVNVYQHENGFWMAVADWAPMSTYQDERTFADAKISARYMIADELAA